MRGFAKIACLVLLLTAVPAAVAADKAGPGASGLPVPRFVSLASDQVNMRTGPGVRYPIVWVYGRKGLPLLVTAEFEYWRRVQDLDGIEGWVHKSLLRGRRTAIVIGETRELREEPAPDATVIARLEAGVVGNLTACVRDWCRLEVDDHDGWVRREGLFGTLTNEIFE